IVLGENANVAYRFIYLPRFALAFDEIALDIFGRHAGDDALVVNAVARPLQSDVAHVGAEYLYGMREPLRAHVFHELDSYRVDFLAGRAARHPDTDRFFRRAFVDYLGEHFCAERGVEMRIAEKFRYVDEDVFAERLRLIAVF